MPGSSVKLYGAPYSVYVRICRMALAAKRIEYELVPVDVFAEGGPGAEHLERHPFGKIPAFAHGRFELFETDAIVSYVARAFEGPSLEFADPAHHARMRQLMRIVDNYAYPVLVWKCFVPGTREGEKVEAASWLEAEKVLSVVAGLKGRTWMVGASLSLADIYMWAVMDYFRQTDRGRELVAIHDGLDGWCTRMSELPICMQTQYDAGN